MKEGTRILLVDDDPALLRASSRLFEKAGYEVLEAEEGALGLRLAQDHKPHLVLLDVTMPGMDGLAVCRRIKEDEDLADIFVVLFST